MKPNSTEFNDGRIAGMTRRDRRPLRIQRSYDTYTIKTGDAGFVLLIKNGKRIMPKNSLLVFNRRRDLK